tara:strand:+ start:21489 stop:21764 length:276 start_codon:yes stop_codon:yes gene_type:complete
MPANRKVTGIPKNRKPSKFDLNKIEEESIAATIQTEMAKRGKRRKSFVEPILWAAVFRINIELQESGTLDKEKRKRIIKRYLAAIFPDTHY